MDTITTKAPDTTTMEGPLSIETRTEAVLRGLGFRPSQLLDVAMTADGWLTVRLLPHGSVVA